MEDSRVSTQKEGRDGAGDMTSGTIWKQILFFSLPLLVGNVFQQLYSMVDTIIVGRFLGTTALAAVGATGAITFLILGFAMGMAAGFAVIVAQKFGAGDEEGVKKSVGTAIWLAIILTVILTIVAVSTARLLLKFMNTPDDIIDLSQRYITIIYAGIGASVYYNLIASIVRALGDSRTPLYFLIFSSIFNILLDLYLIAWCGMGVGGAAFATVFSQLLSAVLCTIYSVRKFPLLRLKKRHMAWDRPLAWEELRVGLPMAFQYSITAFGVMILQSAVNQFGSTVIAAYTAATKVEMLVNQLTNSLGMAMATYVGQNVGAKRWDRVRSGVTVSIVMSLIYSAIAMMILIFAGGWITSLFTTEPTEEILYYSRTYLNTIAIFMPALGLLYVFRNSLQGMGDGFVPMCGGLAELLTRFVISSTLPAYLGYLGVCLASPLAWVAAALVVIIRYLTWMRKIRRQE